MCPHRNGWRRVRRPFGAKFAMAAVLHFGRAPKGRFIDLCWFNCSVFAIDLCESITWLNGCAVHDASFANMNLNPVRSSRQRQDTGLPQAQPNESCTSKQHFAVLPRPREPSQEMNLYVSSGGALLIGLVVVCFVSVSVDVCLATCTFSTIC